MPGADLPIEGVPAVVLAPSFFGPLLYRQLRQQTTMGQVLNLLAFQPTWRRGPQLRGRCLIPGCRSTSPRPFSVHLVRQIYRCFACSSHGKALDLWAAVRGLLRRPAG